MNLSEHCFLCENYKHDVMIGAVCGLTNEKPNFNTKCPNIVFDKKYEKHIEKVNVDFEKVRKYQLITKISAIAFSLLGIAALAAGLYLGQYYYERGYLATPPIVIMVAGFSVVTGTLWSYKKYLTAYTFAKNKKSRMDSILKMYNIEYEIDIKINKAIMDDQDVTTSLRFTRKNFK